MRAQRDKFGGRKKKKLEEEDRTKVSRRRAAGAGVGTHAAEQRAGAQAGPHGGSGAGSRRGARQRGAGGGISSGSRRPGLAPPLGPLAPPRPHPTCPSRSLLAASRWRWVPPGTHLGQVRWEGPMAEVGGARIPVAARAAQLIVPDSSRGSGPGSM